MRSTAFEFPRATEANIDKFNDLLEDYPEISVVKFFGPVDAGFPLQMSVEFRGPEGSITDFMLKLKGIDWES